MLGVLRASKNGVLGNCSGGATVTPKPRVNCVMSAPRESKE